MKADVDDKSGVVAGGADRPGSIASGSGASIVRSRLFIKYVALFVTVVVLALLANGAFEVWFSYQEHKSSLIDLQHQQAQAASDKIEEFVTQIDSQVGWTTQLPWTDGTLDQRRFDALRLLRQVPAITELAQVDASGHEQLKVSRLTMDVVGSGVDYSQRPEFEEAVAKKVYYGPVYFRRESEPYMTIALAGARRDSGVSIAQVNLKLIWDVVSKIKVGEHGHAYVVDADGRLIAHPDISLVLRNTDMSRLAQVQSARAGSATEAVQEANDISGHRVLTAYAPVVPLGWFVFVETPIEEAYAPLYTSIQRLGYVLFGALALAAIAGLILARRMVVPIQALRAGAARIGGGDLSQRIGIKTGDEVEALADQFNDMAGKLQESYATLERKVEQRTAELRESLEQQTAISEILRVISKSPDDVQPVLNAVAEHAARICKAQVVDIILLGNNMLHSAAVFGELSRDIGQVPLDRATVMGRSICDMQPVQFADQQVAGDDFARGREFARRFGHHAILAVPLIREGRALGCILIRRTEVKPFEQKDIALLTTFANQAAIAIENVRLYKAEQERTRELSESLEQQTATSEVLKVISTSPGELKPVFEIILENATRICEANFGLMYTYDGTLFHNAAMRNAPSALVEFHQKRGAFRPPPGTPLNRLLQTREVIRSADDSAEPTPSAPTRLAGARSHLAVPMLKDDALVGAIIIYRQEVRPFTEKQVTLVQNFASQAVVAIENTRLLSELRQRTEELTASLHDLRTAQDRLVQTEKLASLGQLTAGIAHEIKNPLNFVNNFSSLSTELMDELNEVLATLKTDEKTRKEIDEIAVTLRGNLEKIVQHGKRADSIVKNMLLHSREGSGEHRPVDINTLVEESLNLAYHGARAEKQGFNITLERSFDPAAGEVDLYPQEITRVLLNLISNGFYAAMKRKGQAGDGFEPVLAAATKNLGDRVEIRIRDNGTGIPPEVKDKMFNPFFTTKPAGEGTGLGLSISHDIIVKQHAGSILVDTEPGQFTEFKIVLPRTAASIAKPGGRA
jgi:signal transduction histidine kinase/HAMP domain-containing protein